MPVLIKLKYNGLLIYNIFPINRHPVKSLHNASFELFYLSKTTFKMFNLFHDLPMDLVGTKVLGMLDIRDIVMLERACGSKASHQHYMILIPCSPAVVLPLKKHDNKSSLEWLAKRRCKITSLTVALRLYTPALHVKNLQVDNINLRINSEVQMHHCQPLFESELRYMVKAVEFIDVTAVAVDKEVMEQLSIFTENIEIMKAVIYVSNWLTVDILSRWKLKEITFVGSFVDKVLLTLILQTCTELTSLELRTWSTLLDDSVVVNIVAQHCPKLKTLRILGKCNITYKSLLALSEQCLLLAELYIPSIPNIPTAHIARRCSRALSCIPHLNTGHLDRNAQDFRILLPYMTGLTSVHLCDFSNLYIPLLTQHCSKITTIKVDDGDCDSVLLLSLCRANPLLQELSYNSGRFTDTALIELIHACPHLHTLRLPYETAITDIGMLALSEYCPQLQCLYIGKCKQVTDAAVIQLL